MAAAASTQMHPAHAIRSSPRCHGIGCNGTLGWVGSSLSYRSPFRRRRLRTDNLIAEIPYQQPRTGEFVTQSRVRPIGLPGEEKFRSFSEKHSSDVSLTVSMANNSRKCPETTPPLSKTRQRAANEKFKEAMDLLYWIVASLGLETSIVLFCFAVVWSVYFVLCRLEKPAQGVWRLGLAVPLALSLILMISTWRGKLQFCEMMIQAQAFNEEQAQLFLQSAQNAALNLTAVGIAGTIVLLVTVGRTTKKRPRKDAPAANKSSSTEVHQHS